ncbi:hypothetical protein C1H46_025857 [Malus baccata]|uniref:Proteasome subunit alpha type n=1 Tax=Malus baccata TaxID=106549 RepID=A0A540LQ32_MALBA|nr:hypothetical protein C1H46_025857 [Malus baccata]
MGDSQYSFSLTTFSPSGKLVQIEHALTAVGSGQTSLGIKAANGVVIATEKKLPSILVDEASEPIPVTQLVREVAAVMQEFTQSGGVRPFGVSLLVAGFDDKGPQLFQLTIHVTISCRYTEDMELDDAVHTAILTLKEGFEGQISGKNIEIGIIGADKKFRQVSICYKLPLLCSLFIFLVCCSSFLFVFG